MSDDIKKLDAEISQLSAELREEEQKFRDAMRENEKILEELKRLEKIVLRKREVHLNLSDAEKMAHRARKGEQ